MCDEKAIKLFLGKCIKEDGFKVCPGEPVVVEHLHTQEHHTSEDHYHLAHQQRHVAIAELHKAFQHGSCFKVDHTFVCEEDLDHFSPDDIN